MALSPMMQQYFNLKNENPDCIIFFRLGDFYEMFFEDAVEVSRELGLTLTGRDCGLEERAPMCGVPWHSAEGYIAQLVQKGYKVAVCEQLTDPAESKGLVERGVARIVTAGTITQESVLPENANNYLLSVFADGNDAGLCYADVTTGELVCVQAAGKAELSEALFRINPAEIIANSEAVFLLSAAGSKLKAQVVKPLAGLKECLHVVEGRIRGARAQLKGMDECAFSAAMLLKYLESIQLNPLAHINTISVFNTKRHMVLDPVARRNLELTKTMFGSQKGGTLFHLLNKTSTSMGARTLRHFIESPLYDIGQITKRQRAVGALAGSYVAATTLSEALKQVYDIERLNSKLAYGSINARDMLALKKSVDAVPQVIGAVAGLESDMIAELRSALDPMEDISRLIGHAICDEPPATIKEGGIIRQGYHNEVDRLRDIATGGKQWLMEFEAGEREQTGIRNLKVGYNRVFGYYIEVSKSQLDLVPYTYNRRQTLANCERFFTQELKEAEEELLGAQDKLIRLEHSLFLELRETLLKAIARFKSTAGAVKVLDALNSLALCAIEYDYVCPQMTEGYEIDIEEGRHPVVERMGEGQFVPNDAHMSESERMMIVTGPNMAGKSTYMRQVALIVLMAHMGSFVPAKSAKISLTDRIFTRIGAQDNLASGQSTFMVEMTELSDILSRATVRSLLILDEIGRGTSTFDGLSIAWAAVEHIADNKKLGAKTLFATHYHELSQLEGRLPGVVNYRISVKEHGDEIIFLRKIVRGGSDRSFGIQVAALAGLPRSLVSRSMEIMARLQASDMSHSGIGSVLLNEPKGGTGQVDMASLPYVELCKELAAIDVNSMTPVEALNELYMLREKAKLV